MKPAYDLGIGGITPPPEQNEANMLQNIINLTVSFGLVAFWFDNRGLRARISKLENKD